MAFGLAAGCGDEDEPANEPASSGDSTEETGGTIKVAVLSDCEGPFGVFFEPTVSGINQALIDAAGGKPAGEKPSDGVEGATIGGKQIEIVGYGCSNDTADKAIEETRRLMEQEDADILVGPLSGDEGIAVANYAKEHPDKTFVNGIAGAQDATLKVQAPNFFRYHPDGAQWSAGLGDYAYNELGWRQVVTMGDDYDFPYTQIAGFTAEFCALGGQVVERLWPPLGEEDYSSYITQIPDDVDGFFLGVGGTGTVAFVKQYGQLGGNLADKIIGGVFMTDPVIHKELGDRVVGVVTAGMTATDTGRPEYDEYASALAEAYPPLEGTGSSVFAYGYYTAMQAIIESLEQVDGDLSNDHEAFREAMSELTLNAPLGEIKLDENRQAIMDNFLQKIVGDTNGDGVPEVETIAT
ncbi:MAG TPA: ABC transporter substrate-binding protein, partial [Solirubrobacteraceae bacterium]|nr:ABC transporter substrate-binding protein [Solirubrobacteraceae bacterium]